MGSEEIAIEHPFFGGGGEENGRGMVSCEAICTVPGSNHQKCSFHLYMYHA